MEIKKNKNFRTVNFDISSIDDLNQLINICKCLRSNLLYGGPEAKKNEFLVKTRDEVYDSCHNIINCDINHIYSGLDLDETKKYYVYAHCNTGFKIDIKRNAQTTFAATLGMTYVPFYIGKGTGNRCNDINRSETHRKYKQINKKLGGELDVVIIKDNLSELEAFILEAKLIDIFGLRVWGNKHNFLTNLDEGYHPDERRNLYMEDFLKIRGSDTRLWKRQGCDTPTLHQ